MAKKLNDIMETIFESSGLNTYLSSIGIEPSSTSRENKIGHSRSEKFKKWKSDRTVENVSPVDESGVHSHSATIVDKAGNLVNKFSYEAKNKKKAKKIAKKRVTFLSKSSPESSFRVSSVKKVSKEEIQEDTFQDPQAATQTTFDGANNPKDVSERTKQLSKTARMIKALYKHHRVVKEETYAHDAEREYVPVKNKKEPKQPPEDKNAYGDKPKARAVMSGGKTSTGQKRDDVEIDPPMVMPDLGKK